MNRKGFLKHSARITAALALGAGWIGSHCRKSKESTITNSNAGKRYIWRMVTTWPKNFLGLGTAAQNLTKNINEMSNGRLEIKVYAANELVPPYEVFNAVSRGTAEMGHGAAYYWKGIVPEAQFFASIPFGLHSTEMSAWLYYGGGQELWRELYKKYNLQPFACANTGVQMGGWFNKLIETMDDFKGLKLRMPGLGGEVIRRAGAAVVSLPGGEIFQTMRSGGIDAAEWIGPYNDLAFGLYKAGKYYYWPGWQEPGTILELLVNKEKYEELPKSLQTIVSNACQSAYTAVSAEFMRRNSSALQTLMKKHKVKLKRFPDPVLFKLYKLSNEVVKELAQKSKQAQKIHQSYMQFRKEYQIWNKISEQSLNNLRRSL